MATKVYKSGEKCVIEKGTEPQILIPIQFAAVRIVGDTVTIYSVLDATLSEFDTVANIQNQAGTNVGALADVVKYLNSFIFIGSTSSDSTTGGGGSGGTGEANTASNVGTGAGVFKQKTGVDLEFKSLTAGTNITLTQNANDIEISASGGGGSSEAFYLQRVETINNATATDVEFFTYVQGGTEITNTITATGGNYFFEYSFLCFNTSKSGRVVINPQVNSTDIFSNPLKREPKDSSEVFYICISKQIALSAGTNTIQLQLQNEGNGTARIFEANVKITKV